MIKSILKFFDKLEDRVRGTLSHRPILYTIIGATAIVLFWRGIWMTADQFSFLTGPVSIIVSVIILLLTGLFVSFFIGDVIILSGLKQEHKTSEKTEEEIRAEADVLRDIKMELDNIKRLLEEKNKTPSAN